MHYAVVIAWDDRAQYADDYVICQDTAEEYDWGVFDYRTIGEPSRFKYPFKLKKSIDRFFDETARVNEAVPYKRDPIADPDESRCYQCTKKCIDIKNSIIPDIYIDKYWGYHEFQWPRNKNGRKDREKDYMKWFNSLEDDVLLTVVDVHI